MKTLWALMITALGIIISIPMSILIIAYQQAMEDIENYKKILENEIDKDITNSKKQ